MTDRHGVRGRTYDQGCRCPQCRAANTLRCALQRERRLAQRVRRGDVFIAVAEHLTHGHYGTYRNWGCECRPCHGAHLAQLVDYRRRVRHG